MNERWGTARCDEFLRELADRMREHVPGIVLGGRIGADVFAFLTEHRDGGWEQAPEELMGQGDSSRFVVKYAVYEDVDHTLSASTICDRATLAIREIKGNVKTTVSWFSEEMRNAQIREHQIVDNADAAIKNREFQVYYQPDLQSIPSPGLTEGMEEHYDVVIWLDILPETPVYEREFVGLASALLAPGGALYFTAGKQLYKIPYGA